MGEARIFTIRQCPDCMCDFSHISGLGGLDASVNGRSRQIGTILCKFFPNDGTGNHDVTGARLAGPHRLAARGREGVGKLLNPRIAVAKQHNGRVLTDQNRFQKIPNLKAFRLRFFAGTFNGETMATATSFVNPAELQGVGFQPTAQARSRRVRQRRQVQAMIGGSYVIDAGILLLYAHAGSTSALIGPAYAVIGLILVAIFLAVSEAGINDRFEDHYLIAPQSMLCMLAALAFAYVAPEVGGLFLCTLFIVVGFSSLRASPRQTLVIWTAMTAGIAGLFLLTDKPVSMPHGNHLERFATMLAFVMTIGRCMFLGIFSSSMKQSLYQSGLKLKEAYKRIEELAELDELTGASNRRCIMRMLDEEVARAARSGAPCSVALIDLDWFKRINDAFGHPTGDEVLRTFAITMFANIRVNDRFGRYGGEEFLLVLPDMDSSEAVRALDRLRAIVSDLDWSAFSPGMKVTISAGVATLRQNETPDTLLARADGALYAAKARGRNRVAHV